MDIAIGGMSLLSTPVKKSKLQTDIIEEIHLALRSPTKIKKTMRASRGSNKKFKIGINKSNQKKNKIDPWIKFGLFTMDCIDENNLPPEINNDEFDNNKAIKINEETIEEIKLKFSGEMSLKEVIKRRKKKYWKKRDKELIKKSMSLDIFPVAHLAEEEELSYISE